MKNTKLYKNNKSRIAGVYWHKRQNRWQAYVTDNAGKKVHLGVFKVLYDAALARYNAEQSYNYSCHEGNTSAKAFIDNYNVCESAQLTIQKKGGLT